MGRDMQDWSVSWTVSRHNSDRDRADDALAAELVAELRAVVEQDKYEPIEPVTF
jgi:hypothetical protein